MDLNLHQVRYLVAVVDEGHFGRAAQRLYISPPALSQQVRKLERYLGVDLLDRSTRPVVPTEAGRRFLCDARAALEAADRAVGGVAAYLRERSGTLRLGFITGATGPCTRQILDELATTAPGDAVQLVWLAWSQQANAVRAGNVDAAFVRPPITDTSGLRLELVFDEPRVAVLPLAHRLAGRRAVGIGELDGEVQVTDDEADPAWLRWWSCDPRPSGIPVRYGPVVHTMDELLEVVASGRAVAITASTVADSHQRSDVAFVPILDVAPSPVSLCTRRGDRNPAVLRLREALRRVRARQPTAERAGRLPGEVAGVRA